MKVQWFSKDFSFEMPRTWKDPTSVPKVGFKVLRKGISLVFTSRAILHEKQTCLSIIKGSKSMRKNNFFYAWFWPIFISTFWNIEVWLVWMVSRWYLRMSGWCVRVCNKFIRSWYSGIAFSSHAIRCVQNAYVWGCQDGVQGYMEVVWIVSKGIWQMSGKVWYHINWKQLNTYRNILLMLFLPVSSHGQIGEKWPFQTFEGFRG